MAANVFLIDFSTGAFFAGRALLNESKGDAFFGGGATTFSFLAGRVFLKASPRLKGDDGAAAFLATTAFLGAAAIADLRTGAVLHQ